MFALAHQSPRERAPSRIMADQAMRRLPAFWIGFLVVAAARALIAASRLDDFRGEELYQGSLAWALLRGLPPSRGWFRGRSA